ncbi:MAG: hypothetical protein Q9182_006730 [Xanthomendoza sp. 2 TL-2023]
MSYGPFVSIPPGYCFIPSCPAKPNTPSSTSVPTRSLTTSTTTIIGPTITASLPHSKRAAATDNGVKAMLGTQPFAAFPTDAAIPIGPGPICIVHCDWAKMQNNGETFRPAIRPTSIDEITTSTIMTLSKATLTISSTLPSPTQTPHHHLSPAPKTTTIILASIASLALLLTAAYLLTRKIRSLRAKLNPRNQGVQRDREREIFEQEGGGKGVPEMGGRADVGQRV